MIRELFRQAKLAKPSLIFLDELDGICPNRENAGHGSSTVVSTFLAEMDDLVPGQVFVFAATNRISRIDSALLRPGRFDKHLEFFPPSIEGRIEILRIYTKKWPRSSPNEQYLRQLASFTAGMTGK
jgi:SpoVK/Ycf46/Vps4 family AAA+-type ATPase